MTSKSLALAAFLAAIALDAAAQTPPPANASAAPTATPAAPVTPPASASDFRSRPMQANGDLVATLRADGRFSTFIRGLESTNLVDLLKKQPNLTVFAPTDAAFATLPPAELQALMADKAGLQRLLVRHLINARVDASKIKGAKGPVPSVAGDTLMLDGSEDRLLVDQAAILQTDVMAANGVLHVVDKVLRADSGAAAAAPAASQGSAGATAVS